VAGRPGRARAHLQTVLFSKVIPALLLGGRRPSTTSTPSGPHLRRMREADRPQAGRRPARRVAVGSGGDS
jgi:hypothetical protein